MRKHRSENVLDRIRSGGYGEAATLDAVEAAMDSGIPLSDIDLAIVDMLERNYQDAKQRGPLVDPDDHLDTSRFAWRDYPMPRQPAGVEVELRCGTVGNAV